MATFFGEVLEIRSRAVDDCEDADDEDIPTIYFDLDSKYGDISSLPSYTTVVVATGIAPSIFVESYLVPDSHELLGHIKLNLARTSEADVLGIDYSRQPNTVGKLLFDTTHSIIFCTSEKEVPQESAAEVARYFVDLAKNPVVNAIALTALPHSHYKTIAAVNFPILRHLQTHINVFQDVHDLCVPRLETPNTVSGLGAALLTECEVRNFPGLLVVCFNDHPDVDSASVRAFEPLLKLDCFRDLTRPLDICRKTVSLRVRNSKIDRGNLYF